MSLARHAPKLSGWLLFATFSFLLIALLCITASFRFHRYSVASYVRKLSPVDKSAYSSLVAS